MTGKFFGISADKLQNIQGLLPAISAAEMLVKDYPKISTALLIYSSKLIDKAIATYGTNTINIDVISEVKSLAKGTPASASELETFADNILKAKTKDSSEIARLAYLCYAATTIHGALDPQVARKLSNAEQQSQSAQKPTHSHQIKGRSVSQKSIGSHEKPLALIFAEIAQAAFLNKDKEVALTALTAAITELEKSK